MAHPAIVRNGVGASFWGATSDCASGSAIDPMSVASASSPAQVVRRRPTDAMIGARRAVPQVESRSRERRYGIFLIVSKFQTQTNLHRVAGQSAAVCLMVVFWEEHQSEAEVRSIQFVVTDTIALQLAPEVTTGKQDSVMICRQQGSR